MLVTGSCGHAHGILALMDCLRDAGVTGPEAWSDAPPMSARPATAHPGALGSLQDFRAEPVKVIPQQPQVRMPPGLGGDMKKKTNMEAWIKKLTDSQEDLGYSLEIALAVLSVIQQGASWAPRSPPSVLPTFARNPPAMTFFTYSLPSSFEVKVGQKVEAWPSASDLRGCRFAIAPKLPPGLMLDEQKGLIRGRPQHPTPGQ
ncbi:unnamed protein product, partial [Symbiodinium natans]